MSVTKVILKEVWAGVEWLWDKMCVDSFARFILIVALFSLTGNAIQYVTCSKTPKEIIKVEFKEKIKWMPGKIEYIDKEGTSHEQTFPPEGSAAITPNGVIAIKRRGLCLMPFGGCVWAEEKAMPYGGVRVAYWNRFGLEVGANNERLFAGADMRVPYFQNILLAVGGTSRYNDVMKKECWGLYGGVSVALR